MASKSIKPSSSMWVLGAAFLFLVGLWWFGPNRSGGGSVDVILPELSRQAAAGQKAFADICAVCHGDLAGGTDQGPPLVHKIYEPSHHADAAFLLAANVA